MREKPLCIAQERAFALHASQLLEECEGHDLGVVRKALYGFVASSATRVEEAVSVVDEAEEHRESLFRVVEAWGKVGGWAIYCSLVRGVY